MNTNLTQHPCAGKCQRYRDEQCNTCLIQQIDKREFDLGVAPDDAYVKKACSDLLVGDVVVAEYSTELLVVKYIYPKGKIRVTDGVWGRTVDPKELRPATTAEIQAKRRLTNAEQALAEVS
ncbi:hypothetical protein [Acinetobacter bereziniae]|uniref:hypothetical protein n=1 Tax=Acinetobacter bereziniae TaxID=106648 RepID=UPI0019001CE3|nr:hypothetical protein [Acinetobacter bereziniae]MBJ8476607.1 hypothetical protein [Acinetobacter bereziniae]